MDPDMTIDLFEARATIELFEARANLEQGGLPAALANLRYKRGTILDCPDTGPIHDRKFDKEHPDHPQAAPQRFIRIEAADRIKDIAETAPSSFGEDELAALHEALLDRSPAVRLSIVKTLELLNRRESDKPLADLLQVEDESEWVRSAILRALSLARHGTA